MNKFKYLLFTIPFLFIFITNISAYTAETYYLKVENVENYVLEHVPDNDKWTDFDISNYPYVLINLMNTRTKSIGVYFFKSLEQLNAVTIEKNQYGISIYSGNDFCGYTFRVDGIYDQDLGCTGGSGGYISTYFSTNYNYKDAIITNFDISKLKINDVSDGAHTVEEVNKLIYKLDFSNFGKVEFKDDLFSSNLDFKEVCVPVNKTFGITFADGHEYNDVFGHTAFDFIWFKHGVTGLTIQYYDTLADGYIKDVDDITLNPDEPNFFNASFWLRSKEVINYAWSIPNISSVFTRTGMGYENYSKYDFYDYTFYPIVIDFNDYGKDKHFMFPIFYFNSPGIHYVDSDNVDYSDNYCFYLKKDYDVVVFNKDEFGDIYGSVNTPDGKTDVTSTNKRDSYNSDSSSSTILTFISEIKDELIFLKDSIYDFYSSMPFLLRLFIITIFNILLFKIILGMVVR